MPLFPRQGSPSEDGHGDIRGIAHHQDMGTAGFGGAHAMLIIFDDHAFLRRQIQFRHGRQIHFRIRLRLGDILVRHHQVEKSVQPGALHHQLETLADGIGAHRQPVSRRFELGERVLMLEHRVAALLHHIDSVFLLHLVDEAMQPARQGARFAEHVELGAGGKSVETRQMGVAVDLEPERRQRLVERLVMPVARVDQDAVHVEQHGLDPALLEAGFQGAKLVVDRLDCHVHLGPHQACSAAAFINGLAARLGG